MSPIFYRPQTLSSKFRCHSAFRLRAMPLVHCLVIVFLFLAVPTEAVFSKAERCRKTIQAEDVIRFSYFRAIDFIRQGMPSSLVSSVYNTALLNLANIDCICEKSGKVSLTCFQEVFVNVPGEGNITTDFIHILEEEKRRTDKYFPDMIPWKKLPPAMTALRELVVRSEMTKTEVQFMGKIYKAWKTLVAEEEHISRFPPDESIRFDPGRTDACLRFRSMNKRKHLSLSASALTAYVIGIVEQIILAKMDREAAKVLLDKHIMLVYTAARCKRRKGEQLEVPTMFLDEMITKAFLVIMKAKLERSSTVLSTFPKLTAVRHLTLGSQKLFGDIIDRLEGLGSLGQSRYLSWEGGVLKAQYLHEILGKEATFPMFSHFYTNSEKPKRFTCKTGFGMLERLDPTSDDLEHCCSLSCTQTQGNLIDLAIMNEMCCRACNGIMCSADALVHVQAVQAARSLQKAPSLGDEI